MGMDPIKQGELCELTIVLEGGPVSVKAIKKFKKLIDDAIKDANEIEDEEHGDDKLRVRLTRFIIR